MLNVFCAEVISSATVFVLYLVLAGSTALFVGKALIRYHASHKMKYLGVLDAQLEVEKIEGVLNGKR